MAYPLNASSMRVLVIAGHDPSGGAGVQADTEAIISQGGQVATAITALTVQDYQQIYQLEVLAPKLTMAQARIVLEQQPVAVIKLGLLGSVAMVAAVRTLLRDYPHIPAILDPILASDRGNALTIEGREAMAQAIVADLLPLVTLVTPNTLELNALAPAAQSFSEQISVLQKTGCEAILVTGTHDNTGIRVIHRLFETALGIEAVQTLSWPRLPHHYHGSGCTLAASIAGLMAQGWPLRAAVAQAQQYTWHSLHQAAAPGITGCTIPHRFYWRG